MLRNSLILKLKDMEQNLKYVAGIDISKKTFDITISDVSLKTVEVDYRQFDNNLKGFKQLKKWLKSLKVNVLEVLFCMENTGIYHRLLASYLRAEEAFVWVENGTQIKWSMGVQRGKNDKVDSGRIMTYAKRHIDSAKQYEQKDKDLQQVADLLAVRKRLMDSVSRLKVPAKELKSAGLKDQAAIVLKVSAKSIKALEKDIANVEVMIKELIKNNEELNEVYSYTTSVKSVGFVAASYLLVYTNGFTRFTTSKQIASYCGIAPFEFSSGTSIKGRTRVHHMANKDLKSILHMCAISALASNQEMKVYFKRKVDEGKNKMSVINAVRNKILSRVFSCVKNKKMYEPYLA